MSGFHTVAPTPGNHSPTPLAPQPAPLLPPHFSGQHEGNDHPVLDGTVQLKAWHHSPIGQAGGGEEVQEAILEQGAGVPRTVLKRGEGEHVIGGCGTVSLCV